MTEAPSILAQFVAFRCPACTGRKQSQTAFCGNCYHSLPLDLKRKLWRRFGEGFEEAFSDGLAWLQKEQLQKELWGKS